MDYELNYFCGRLYLHLFFEGGILGVVLCEKFEALNPNKLLWEHDL